MRRAAAFGEWGSAALIFEQSSGVLPLASARRDRRLKVIWDNAPAHRGEAVREYLRTPGVKGGGKVDHLDGLTA